MMGSGVRVPPSAPREGPASQGLRASRGRSQTLLVSRDDPVRLLDVPELRPDPNQLLTIDEAAAEAGGLHWRSISPRHQERDAHALELRTAPQARPMYR